MLYNIKTFEIIEEFKKLGVYESEGNIIFPEGNAIKNLSQYFDKNRDYINPYEDKPDDIRTISIEADNTVFGSSIQKYSIIDIINDYRV